MEVKNVVPKALIGVQSSVMFCSKIRDLGFSDQALMIDKDYKKARIMMNHSDLSDSIVTVYLELTAPSKDKESDDVIDDFRVYVTKIEDNKEEIIFDQRYDHKNIKTFFDNKDVVNTILSSRFKAN